MIASPSDYPGLDVEKEWARLSEALDILARRGLVTLERLEDARLSVLQRKLRGGEYHVLHFVGHGGFDRESQDGVIILRDETGKGRPVAAQHLGTILHDHRSLRLVVLNACEGSRASRTDPFAGTAQTLVQQGIPAVIAMQFEITADITFAEEFYAATADGYPVDAALAEARKAIFGTSNDIEWGTPVLYLRAPDGQLFVVNRPAPTEAQGLRPSQTEQPAGVPAGAASAAVKDQSAGGTERGPERAAPDRAERVVRGSGPAWFRRRRTPIGLSIAGFLAALALASVVRSVDRTFSLFVLLFALAQIVVVLLRLKWPAYLLAILNAVALAFAIIAVNSVRRSEVPEWLFFVLTVALGGSATSLSAWNRDAPDSTRPKREGREQ